MTQSLQIIFLYILAYYSNGHWDRHLILQRRNNIQLAKIVISAGAADHNQTSLDGMFVNGLGEKTFSIISDRHIKYDCHGFSVILP